MPPMPYGKGGKAVSVLPESFHFRFTPISDGLSVGWVTVPPPYHFCKTIVSGGLYAGW